MQIHFSLDFTTPFGVGDQVFVLHPPKEVPYHGGPAWLPYRKGTIVQVKLIFDLDSRNGLIVKQSLEEQVLRVNQVVYTIVCPPSDHHQSAFCVECPTNDDSERRLFHDEETIKAYLQPASI